MEPQTKENWMPRPLPSGIPVISLPLPALADKLAANLPLWAMGLEEQYQVRGVGGDGWGRSCTGNHLEPLMHHLFDCL